jgi:hypothetical protein
MELSRERHDKFAESTFTLSYTSLSAFFGGLEARVGAPSPNLRVAMRAEHCTGVDSSDEFTTGNYGVTTTPQLEWHVAVDPEEGLKQLRRTVFPEETRDIEGDRKRSPQPLRALLPRLEEKNTQLRALGEPELIVDELLSGRLYTGPMCVPHHNFARPPLTSTPRASAALSQRPPNVLCRFQKYNLVCRAAIDEAPDFLKQEFASGCKGNHTRRRCTCSTASSSSAPSSQRR